MLLKKWDDLPEFMKNEEVREYYDILKTKKLSLVLKRLFDLVVGVVVFVILLIPMAVIAVMIKKDSPGTVFYCQERITTYGKKFKIYKFRTMITNAEKLGSAVTVYGDIRITKMGKKLRKYRLDELPQIFNVLIGNMSFVGTRPEVTKYVEKYSCEMLATLLMPAGITSEASIRYKNEAELLNMADDIDKVYIERILPEKMKYNLKSIKNFSFLEEIKTVLRTILAVMGKEYK